LRTLCFTVDLDRDVNEPVFGSVCAASKDRGEGNSPRFASAGKGTEKLVELFDELGIRATFFAEARTLHRSGAFSLIKGHEVALHGMDHEDFSGEKTGIHMDEGDMREIIERSISLIRDCVGYQPKGFRAPYMNADDTLMSFLPEYGIRYDSSYYAYVKPEMLPYRLENRAVEIPVIKGSDKDGRSITSYLWPMHEGERGPEDFIGLARQVEEGIFVLATHSWHICETYGKGKLDADGMRRNIDSVRHILETLEDDGFNIRTMSDSIA
jgi:peptidoglycan/xylan/chitin deacetylase (PgdA/CDA1 family)